MYGNESKGQLFPPLKRLKCDATGVITHEGGFNAIPDGYSVYPEYLSDANIYNCPSDAQPIKIQDGEWS